MNLYRPDLLTPERIDFHNLATRLSQYLRGNKITRLLIGLSGGADSILLYHLLREISRDNREMLILISHVNFRLRGDESLRDQQFVERLIKENPPLCDYKLIVDSFATADYSSKHVISIEMAARDLRHSRWEELRDQYALHRILTGHHADDNVETLLLNLLRGSGISGLKSMLPDDGRILRPLIHIHRPDIATLLDMNGWQHITDHTNLDSDYQRNFLRNEVMPLLRSRWASASESIARSIDILQDENRLLNDAISNILDDHKESLPLDIISSHPARRTLIHHWVKRLGGTPTIATEIDRAIANGDCHGQRWNTGKNVTTDRNGNPIASPYIQFILTPTAIRTEFGEGNPRKMTPSDNDKDSNNESESENATGLKNRIKYSVEVISPIDESAYRKIRSASLEEIYLPHPISEYYWRSPRAGERIRLFKKKEDTEDGAKESNKRNASKLVSDVLKEAKVPLAARKHILGLYHRMTDTLVWLPGIRRAGTHLLTPDSPVAYHLTPQK